MIIAGARRRYCNGLWGQVHVQEAGTGTGTGAVPLLLLHQTPWSAVQYEHVLPLLAGQGRVIAIDTPGYGLSDHPSTQPGIADYADNVRLVLDELRIDSVVIGGHHTGGLIAGSFAARHGDRTAGLLLDNTPLYSPDERAARLARPAHGWAPLPEGRHFTERWQYLKGVMDARAGAETVHRAVMTYFLRGPHPCQGHAAAYAHDFEAELPAIRCRTLILANRRDAIFASGARLRAHRPDFELVELEAGSAVVREQPDLWVAAVRPFLASVSAGTGISRRA